MLKKVVVVASSYADSYQWEEDGECPNCGQLFNTPIDKWKHGRRPTVSLYLDELLGLKTVNSEIKSKDQISYLERYSPKGSCHHDESSMSHTLAQNCHCEFCCGVHLTWKKHSRYTWQEWIDERTWKPVKTAIAIVSAKWSEWEADPSPFNKAISLPTWQIAKIVQTLKWPQIGWKKLKLVEKRRGGSWANHVPWPESKILQVRRDDQSRYPPSSRVTSLVGHRPLLKLEVLHLFRCFTHTRTYIHTYIPTYLPTYIPTYINTYINIYTFAYIYIYIYIYKYIYIPLDRKLECHFGGKTWILRKHPRTAWEIQEAF